MKLRDFLELHIGQMVEITLANDNWFVGSLEDVFFAPFAENIARICGAYRNSTADWWKVAKNR